MTKAPRALLALAVAALATLVVAAPASAAKLGGSTLKLNNKTFEAFADVGIAVDPTGPAKFNSNGLHFPLTGGNVDPETGKAKFVHKGGIKFSMGDMKAKFKNPVVKVAGKNVIKAEYHGEKLQFAKLNVKKLDIQEKKNGKFVYSNIKVHLAQKAAKVLASEFGLIKQSLTGAKLGKLTTKFKG